VLHSGQGRETDGKLSSINALTQQRLPLSRTGSQSTRSTNRRDYTSSSVEVLNMGPMCSHPSERFSEGA
jgi:hypothetical protein